MATKSLALAVQLAINPALRPSGLSWLSVSDQLALAEMPASHLGRPPSWVQDGATWKRAHSIVRPKWKRYAYPWAVVAHVYERLGGRVS